MQRSNYGNPPPATSPPLHHPVPQHVSTVPQLRSPPPPVPQQSSGYGTPYQSQAPQGGSGAFGAYGGFINDPTAQMGFQVGQTALKHGTEYVEQNVWSRRRRNTIVKLTKSTVQPIRQRFRAQTLLQCFELLCCKQAILGLVPLEA